MKKTYGTEQAAKKIGVGFRTLNRWLALGEIKPSTEIKMPDGRILGFWTDADIALGRKEKARMKPGPKPKPKKKRPR